MNQAVNIVILDDEKPIGLLFQAYLNSLNCQSTVYTDPAKCLDVLENTPADILITDLCMPGTSGLDVLEKVKRISPETDVIVVTGNADKAAVIKALKLGAFDFLEKPVEKEMIRQTIRRTLRYRQVTQERDLLASQLSFFSEQQKERCGIAGLVSRSPSMEKVMHDIELICQSPNTSVLITGESGTGKELIAHAIHFGSARASHPFVPINCSAVPPDLAESTLFGHVKGAFTGAVAERKGSFELAHNGTLFLDEIGDMSLDMQAKLLRVLEDGTITPVGSSRNKQVNVRILAATNVNIAEQITNRKFRSDLYYRLAGFTISLPPLRDRKTDIPLLARHFNKLISREMGISCPDFDDKALAELRNYDFPGNVRELRNIVERALIESRGDTVSAKHIHLDRLHTDDVPTGHNQPAINPFHDDVIPLNLKEAETAIIRRALAASDGNIAETARIMGISRQKLYRMMASHSITPN